MDQPNVIFIVIDTLRKDYAKPLEEELKKFEFISYDNAITPAPWTTPSHASIFTGLYPAFHKAHETKIKKSNAVRLSSKFDMTLMNHLKILGYETYLFSANIFVSPFFGFSGFDKTLLIYRDKINILSLSERQKIQDLSKGNSVKTSVNLIRNQRHKLLAKGILQKIVDNSLFLILYSKITKWPVEMGASHIINKVKNLETISNKPIFLFFNLMEMHEPYPGLLNSRDINLATIKNWTGKVDKKVIQKYKKGYLKCIEYTNKKIFELIKILKKKELFDDSLIIITSDHGQLLGEHGRINHGMFLYDELLRVPLLIKYPKGYQTRHTESQKYVSLTKLKPFIITLVENSPNPNKILYSNTVYAESYGSHLAYSQMNLSETEKKNIKDLDKYRIAIYYNNFKGIFNISDWKFEKIISYDPNKEVTNDIIKQMEKKILKFLKSSTSMMNLKNKI